ncbi:hypothetical protein DP939_00150 [Spongiactinospora rosea]|uniref:Uncharacterized protein n=1 Tax=Spongiactinospora rosea TaxID=2248750 RepID=A0A366M6N0_9ACTN|nr:hypothetical protein [Spongiactinospora rosea]RBQ21189.1 hypothetical protein DP939_00150 [Spongiactinospora rosea]
MRDRLPPETGYWVALIERLHARLRDQPPEKGGMSAEMMVIVAALVVVAITVMAIVSAKIINKANSINL